MAFKVLNINQLLDYIRFADVNGNTWRLAPTTGGTKFRDLPDGDIQAYIVRNDREFNRGADYNYVAGIEISFAKQSIEATIHAIGTGWRPLSSVSVTDTTVENFRNILYSRNNFTQWVETQLLGAYRTHFSNELLR